jgi:hypothetical protein
LVRNGTAVSGQVSVLPLLPVTDLGRDTFRPMRVDARRMLRLKPGTRLIAASGEGLDGLQRFRTTLASVDRDDVHGLWIDVGARDVNYVHSGERMTFTGLAAGRSRAPAMDVALGISTTAVASSLVVDAVAHGIPLVATPDDAAADVVREYGGRVAAVPDLAAAVLAALSRLSPRVQLPPPNVDRSAIEGALAAATVQAYACALAQPHQSSEVLSRRVGS